MAESETQTTRLIKYQCRACGCIIRITRKWIDEVGAPLCAKHKTPFTKARKIKR